MYGSKGIPVGQIVLHRSSRANSIKILEPSPFYTVSQLLGCKSSLTATGSGLNTSRMELYASFIGVLCGDADGCAERLSMQGMLSSSFQEVFIRLRFTGGSTLLAPSTAFTKAFN